MLRSGLLPLIRSSSIQSSRFYRNRKLYAGDQAGIRKQVKELGDADLFKDDPEGSYEADFNELLPITMHEHQKEMDRHKENVKFKIIEKKYYRLPKMPNLLTWAEKEQIRHLNQNDPEEWDTQRLSESFPATADIIAKILKGKWTPLNIKRVKMHDETVKKNWQAFKANKLEILDPELKEHLAKFSERKFNSSKNAYVLNKNDQIEFKFPKPKHKEFLHIISSCKSLAEKKKSEQIEAGETGNGAIVSEMIVPESELPKSFHKVLKKNMTFDELQMQLGADEKKPDEDDFHVGFPNERNSVKSSDKQNHTNYAVGLEDFEEIALNYSQYSSESKQVELASDESVAQIVHLSPAPKIMKYEGKQQNAKSFTSPDDLIPFIEKIVIPREVKKKGAMYKVNDCFYDDNGDFLFKVPGLDTVWY